MEYDRHELVSQTIVNVDPLFSGLETGLWNPMSEGFVREGGIKIGREVIKIT